MKKVFGALMAAVLAVMLVACGAKTQTATYSLETEQSGIQMKETMTLEAEGDKIVKITDKLEMDFAAFDDSTIEQLKGAYDEIVEQCNSVEGANCKSDFSGSTYTMTLTVDVKSGAANELSDLGLLQVTGDSDSLSLKATEEGLAGNGYVKVS